MTSTKCSGWWSVGWWGLQTKLQGLEVNWPVNWIILVTIGRCGRFFTVYHSQLTHRTKSSWLILEGHTISAKINHHLQGDKFDASKSVFFQAKPLRQARAASRKLTVCYWKRTICRWFTYEIWWVSIALWSYLDCKPSIWLIMLGVN